MGSSAQLRNVECMITLDELGSLKIAFKPKVNQDQNNSLENSLHLTMYQSQRDTADPNDNTIVRDLLGPSHSVLLTA